MNKKLIALLGLDAKATDDQIVAAVEAIHAELNNLRAVNAQRAADEKVIAEKMSSGLSREQAAAVIERQRKFDAEKDKPSKPTKTKK